MHIPQQTIIDLENEIDRLLHNAPGFQTMSLAQQCEFLLQFLTGMTENAHKLTLGLFAMDANANAAIVLTAHSHATTLAALSIVIAKRIETLLELEGYAVGAKHINGKREVELLPIQK